MNFAFSKSLDKLFPKYKLTLSAKYDINTAVTKYY